MQINSEVINLIKESILQALKQSEAFFYIELLERNV